MLPVSHTDPTTLSSAIGNITSNIPLENLMLNDGWGSNWSCSYLGVVLYNEDQGDLVLWLPYGTTAFTLTVQANSGQPSLMTATADNGVSITQTYGADDVVLFGFTAYNGQTIGSITFHGQTMDFAVAELQISKSCAEPLPPLPPPKPPAPRPHASQVPIPKADTLEGSNK